MKTRIVSIILLIVVMFPSCEKFRGPEGKSSLIDFIEEPAGENCINGGFKIIAGIDSSDNGILESNEIDQIKYICNGNSGTDGNDGLDGEDGANTLLEAYTEPPGNNCINGGFLLITGSDNNDNGILDEDEILLTEYICHSTSDKEVRFDLGQGSYFASDASWRQITVARIISFDLSRYPAVDSVQFMGYLYSKNTGVTCSAELFNITDNQSITGSEISASSTSESFAFSTSNFIESFPSKQIDIGIRMKSSIQGENVYLKFPVLVLYRN